MRAIQKTRKPRKNRGYLVVPGHVKQKADPDGIRTRVAALKGPCPRPLDDGAGGYVKLQFPPRRAGQYADRSRGVNGAQWPETRSTLLTFVPAAD